MSGGHEEGGCGAPTSNSTGVYMMEPPQKYDASYRAWEDEDGHSWLAVAGDGCVLEVKNPDTLEIKDGDCTIAPDSKLAAWGIHERHYSYLEIDQQQGTFRISERSRVIDARGEALETCSVSEGLLEKLP